MLPKFRISVALAFPPDFHLADAKKVLQHNCWIASSKAADQVMGQLYGCVRFYYLPCLHVLVWSSNNGGLTNANVLAISLVQLLAGIPAH
jgi:hypothetical protein